MIDLLSDWFSLNISGCFGCYDKLPDLLYHWLNLKNLLSMSDRLTGFLTVLMTNCLNDWHHIPNKNKSHSNDVQASSAVTLQTSNDDQTNSALLELKHLAQVSLHDQQLWTKQWKDKLNIFVKRTLYMYLSL